jgi:hypothetical protein
MQRSWSMTFYATDGLCCDEYGTSHVYIHMACNYSSGPMIGRNAKIIEDQMEESGSKLSHARKDSNGVARKISPISGENLAKGTSRMVRMVVRYQRPVSGRMSF